MENNDVAEKKLVWLQTYGLTFKDVLEDEEGEYVLLNPTLMDEGENESAKPKKVYLPDFNHTT